MNLLKLLCKEKDGNINIDFDDVVLRGVTVVKEGEVTWPAPPIQVSAQPQQAKPQATPVEPKVEEPKSPAKKIAGMAIAVGAFAWIASVGGG